MVRPRALVLPVLLALLPWGREEARVRRHPGKDGRRAIDVVAVDATGRARTRCQGAREPLPNVLLYQLRAAAFPASGNPDVAVHVPLGFDGTSLPGLVVFFHGFENCAANAVASIDAPCTPDGPVRDALHLADQIDHARVNALLVAIELRYDVPDGDPGNLAQAGALRELLHELIVEHVGDAIGCDLDVDSFDPVVVAAHSGGYRAAAAVLRAGDVPQIRELYLFDALYGEEQTFGDWVNLDARRFDRARGDGLRFVDLYTCCGGTADLSRAMAGTLNASLTAAGAEGALLADDSVEELDPDDLETRAIVFKQADAAHVDVPKKFFELLTRTSGLSRLP